MIIEKELGISPDYQFRAYNSKNFLQRNWHRNKLDSINIFLSYLYNVEDKVVLDLGTGSGNFELVMNSKFKKIYGFDYNEEAVDFLNKKIEQNKIKNVETKVIDITKLDLNDIPPKIDIVVMMDVIEHINYAEASKLIRILNNNLSDDGKIIVVTPNYYSPWFLIEKILDKLTIVPKFDGAQHIAKYNFESLNKFFEKENYDKVFTTSINTLGFIFPNNYLCSFINKLEFFSSFKYGNLLVGIYQKKLTKNGKIKVWKNLYGVDQEKLYSNFFVKNIFDLGHKFIAKYGKNRGVYLDFGSGIGYHLNFESKKNFDEYICMDINSTTLKLIDKDNKIKTKVTDGKNVPLEENSVDNIVASHILEHSEDLEAILKEFERVLKKDGKLLVVIPCDPGILWSTLTIFSPSRKRLQMNGLNYSEIMKYEHLNNPKYIVKMIKKYFHVSRKRFYPFLLPSINCNLILCLECSKK